MIVLLSYIIDILAKILTRIKDITVKDASP